MRTKCASWSWLKSGLAAFTIAALALPLASAGEMHRGAPVGFDDEGHPYIGFPEAPVTMTEYSDYLCPFCERYYRQTLPKLIEKYAATGKVKIVFRDFPIVSLHPRAPLAAEAALCAGEQGAALYWAMHDKIFEARNRWANAESPEALLEDLAAAAGVELARYEQCVQDGRMRERVNANIAAGEALGFNATPSFHFSGADDEGYTFAGAYPLQKFGDWLDALLEGTAPPDKRPGELPFWANEEGLAPDPDRPGFTMAGDAYKGSSDASVTVIEFSDFQCPSCRRHALEAQPELDKRFVDKKKVFWVFKNLPLAVHSNAPAAAVAAECAGDQGKFWQLHYALFDRVEDWAEADADAAIPALARAIDLDMAKFQACFGSRQALERVLGDIYDARTVTNSTPTFVVIEGDRAGILRGARDAAQFADTLERALERTSQSH